MAVTGQQQLAFFAGGGLFSGDTKLREALNGETYTRYPEEEMNIT